MGVRGGFWVCLVVVVEVIVFKVVVFLSVAKEWGVWSGMLFVLIYWFQVGCIVVDVGAMSFGSVLFSVFSGWRRVALRVFIAVLSCSLGLVLMPLGSFAIVAGVGWMWYVVVPLGLCVLVMREGHWVIPLSQSGARCLRSLLE